MSEEKFTIKITGPGVELERQIDAAQVSAVLQIALGAAAGPLSPPRTPGVLPGVLPGESLREFFNRVRPKRNPDKITAIGVYLSDVKGQATFKPDEIKASFQQAGERIPGNFPRDFRWAVRNGWIAESPESPGTYYVTSTGNDAASVGFPPEIVKKTSQGSGSPRRRSRGKATQSGDNQ